MTGVVIFFLYKMISGVSIMCSVTIDDLCENNFSKCNNVCCEKNVVSAY